MHIICAHTGNDYWGRTATSVNRIRCEIGYLQNRWFTFPFSTPLPPGKIHELGDLVNPPRMISLAPSIWNRVKRLPQIIIVQCTKSSCNSPPLTQPQADFLPICHVPPIPLPRLPVAASSISSLNVHYDRLKPRLSDPIPHVLKRIVFSLGDTPTFWGQKERKSATKIVTFLKLFLISL